MTARGRRPLPGAAASSRQSPSPSRPRASPHPLASLGGIDPTSRPRPRPTHLSPGPVAVVAAGGALGSLARHAVGTWVDGALAATLAVNVAGAFALGLLLEALARRDPPTRRGHVLRLGGGTGFLGGFTTFSALAIQVERSVADGVPGVGVAYGLGSVVLGLAACAAGVGLAAWRHRGQQRAVQVGRHRPVARQVPPGQAVQAGRHHQLPDGQEP